LKREIDAVETRVVELQELSRAGGGVSNELASLKLTLAEKHTAMAEVSEEIADADLEEALRRVAVEQAKVEIAAALDAITRARAQAEVMRRKAGAERASVAEHYGQAEGWLLDSLEPLKSFTGLELRARKAGVVSELPFASGALVNADEEVLGLLTTSKLVIRAHQPQTRALADPSNYQAKATLANGGGKAIGGTLHAAIEADAGQRVADLILVPNEVPAWLRPGLAMRVEIAPKSDSDAVIAIEKAAVIQDGLEMVYFLRDPKNPDKVMRMIADLGRSDGVWVEVRSGLATGDQVVRKGVYELKLASSSQAASGGHFHADGTWHAEAHD
ncbi:MAG: hypothetical protein KDB07_11815, partial [Planctomycetes bacterium]|nr:hypothetical protein [Planctomycetota bacterium]